MGRRQTLPEVQKDATLRTSVSSIDVSEAHEQHMKKPDAEDPKSGNHSYWSTAH